MMDARVQDELRSAALESHASPVLLGVEYARTRERPRRADAELRYWGVVALALALIAPSLYLSNGYGSLIPVDVGLELGAIAELWALPVSFLVLGWTRATRCDRICGGVAAGLAILFFVTIVAVGIVFATSCCC